MFKKIVIYIGLAALFIFLAAVIASFFVSEMQFCSAKKLESDYNWEKAQDAYRKAAAFSPFSAKYPAALADCILRQSIYYRKDRTLLFEKAEELYKHALALNPRSAGYMLALGETQINLYLSDRERYEGKLREGLRNLKNALDNDPNGINVSLLAGRTGIVIWEILDDDEKKTVLNKLKHVLEYRREYSDRIYRHVWRTTNDFTFLEHITPPNFKGHERLYKFILESGLWQFRKKEAGKMDLYRQKEGPNEFEREAREKADLIESIRENSILAGEGYTDSVPHRAWKGASKDGKKVYESGNMYWAGTIYAPIKLDAGEYTIVIRARGTQADGIFPYMIVGLDGEEIGEDLVDSSKWKEYPFNITTDGGIKVLSVKFINDGSNAEKGEDRNLYVEKARIMRNER